MSKARVFEEILVAGLLILFPVNATTGENSNIHEEFSARVDSLLVLESASNEPGAAVVVTEHGKTIYKRCFGLANLEHEVPISNETVFNLASVSKQFTAMALLLLEQQGKLSLDDDIHQYFPELPEYHATVTLRNLLHHTSGLWEYSTTLKYYGGYTAADHMSVGDVLAFLEHQDQLLFEPGSQWVYCNTNYALLAEMVARLTGESFSSWTTKHVFRPLKMEQTHFPDDCFRVIPHRASSYYKSGEFYQKNPKLSDVTGPAYLWSTIDDMALWLDNFRHHTVGGETLVEKFFQKSVLNDGSESFYGYGLGVSERNGKMFIDHSGQTGSFKTEMIYVRDDELGIVILANNGAISAESLGFKIFDCFYNKDEIQETKVEGVRDAAQPPEPEPFIEMDSIDAEGYGGAYGLEGDQGKVLLSQYAGGLYGIFDGLGSDMFYPVSDSLFMNSLRNVSVRIYRDDDRKTSWIVVDLKGDILRGNRIDHPVMTPEELTSTYAGAYYCDALDIAYNLVVDDARLVVRHRRYPDRPLQITDKDEFAGSIGIVRFSRNEQNGVDGFSISDEDTNFKPLSFKRIDEPQSSFPAGVALANRN